ncbi:hypothetical protein QYE76_055597 [Lolium multiflorum]|uniref:CCHC-type domain-containing protein n=1 Tax=Lolium multiflorum TaxID=4521 RepID=A0AAD8T012_LOLMU|nr:hypothetical protein QYE76_055597 [Lolium multiflorum]
MLCHTCGGKGHFKRDCPNRKVMFINEDNEYETGDDVDPNAPDDDDYDTDGEDAYPSDARTIVVSQRALNVLPSASTQRCNLFQTKALVGPDKACKVIIDGGSCRNLASKELCTKLKLKYLPHPHPYYIQWLSDNGEMKVNHMVRVEFAIGPYKDCIDFDVVPMTEFGDVFPEEVPAGLPPLRGVLRDNQLYGNLEKCTFCKDKYQEETGVRDAEEREQPDVKMDVKLDMEPDMKISHGRAREERRHAREEKKKISPVQDLVGIGPRSPSHG